MSSLARRGLVSLRVSGSAYFEYFQLLRRTLMFCAPNSLTIIYCAGYLGFDSYERTKQDPVGEFFSGPPKARDLSTAR